MIVYGAILNGNLVYIGQTVMSLSQRKGKHVSVARHGEGAIIGAAIRKYGEEAFDWVVLEKCNTQEQLDSSEIKWIAETKAKYNLQEGGKFNFIPWNKGKKETRLSVICNISKAAKNRKRTKRGAYSVEHKEKIGSATAARTRKPFRCDQTGEVFYNKIEAAKKLNLHPSSLLVLLSGKTRLKSLKGYTFKYL